MARLSEPRFASAGGKFIPIKFRQETLPISDAEKIFKFNGSQYPPFNIEPLPYERDRLGEKMSAEDRIRRKIWLQDQVLAKGEPRMEVWPKIKPVNGIRKLYQLPGNMLEGTLSKVMSPWLANNFRVLATRTVRAYVIALGVLYWVKYHSKSWEKKKGFYMHSQDGTTFWKDLRYKESHEYADYGFKERNVLKQ
ncbi:uncharacterized protein LOC134276346 [Saccostrea cucullata]|uniref:uncharacterized protein LOC134276346 n=1 Tax=Saccostrea cuccullata TaxID=36930 RepID=UPI002ED4E649